MKHPLPPLDSLKAFEAAARHLSFSLAADELCMTKGAVSYQIRKLEQHLQCALFKRTVRQVYLTDSGQLLLQTTQQLFDELGDALLRLQGERQQTSVIVAVTTYVAARWLSRHISSFNQQHPGVTVLLQHSVNSADFKLSDVDLAIRWGPCAGRPDRNRLREMPMPLFPVASPALLQRHQIDCSTPLPGGSLSGEPFAQLPLLCEDRHQDLWHEWYTRTRPGITNSQTNVTKDTNAPKDTRSSLPNPRRLISDANVRVQAAIDGQGLILADKLMISELNSGLLCAPFTEQLHGYGYALLSSGNRILSDNSQQLREWLTARTDA